ncbi:hypothetical protein QW131_34485 [Roseibium salinum]|nr:hypothetical protein [Roseibium salinum]
MQVSGAHLAFPLFSNFRSTCFEAIRAKKAEKFNHVMLLEIDIADNCIVVAGHGGNIATVDNLAIAKNDEAVGGPECQVEVFAQPSAWSRLHS